jgi:phosphopantothenoylcysteine decarboxylase/phosphopantothenate--cysteine ligase
MLDAATEAFATADAAVFTAAVADFRPAHPAAHKLKKGRDLPAGGTTTLELVANPDILATLAAHKGARYVVGFAAETEDVVANAQAKLAAKGADLIVANDVSNPELGFASADNRVWFVAAAGVEDSGLIPKTRLAGLIVNRVAAHLRRG